MGKERQAQQVGRETVMVKEEGRKKSRGPNVRQMTQTNNRNGMTGKSRVSAKIADPKLANA